MRDIVVMALVYGCLIFIPFSAFFGILAYSWLAFMRPQDLAWQIRDQSFSLYITAGIGIAMILAAGKEKWVTWKSQTVLMVMMVGWMWLAIQFTASLHNLSKSTRLAAHGLFDGFWKSIVMALLATGIVRTEYRFRCLYWVTAFSLGFLGTKSGSFGLLNPGSRIQEGPGGFMKDNNTYALVLCMTVALLAGIYLAEKVPWVRLLAAGMALFTAFAVIFTFSRGGMLALATVCFLLIFRTGRPGLAIGLMVVGLIGLLIFTPAEFREELFERAESMTLSVDQQDVSVTGRLEGWGLALELAPQYPIFGVGPGNFRYINEQVHGRPKVVHNSYFEWLTDAGIPALGMFLTLLGITLSKLQKMRNNAREEWVAHYASSLQIAIVGYMVGATFLDMGYLDLLYHVVAMSVCLEVVVAAQAETAEPAEAEGSESKPDPGVPWWKVAPEPASLPRASQGGRS